MKKILLLLAAIVLVCAALAGTLVFDAFLVAPGKDAQTVSFVVPEGEVVSTIADQLKNAHLVNSRGLFRVYVWLSGNEANFQAGTFELQEGMSYAKLVDVLTHAESQEVEIMIPEGYTAAQIGEVVRKALPSISADAWTNASKNLEGRLFPDTYRFRADAGAADIAEILTETFDRRLKENEVTLTDDQLILASIIEREVQRPEDMKNVADIFLKRIDAGMPLQADSTVNYVTGGTSPSITYAERDMDSPYNTYQHVGLPPAPISNPGMNAILAVLHPTPNAWYYFLTTPDGTVIYSRTYDEHLTNKAKYLR